jgi:aerobic-type carbon monoxide dehydrogenase small subunit (CoxS/CutS family)
MSGAETLHEVRLRVNGVEHALRVPARRLLADALRHDLGLTGTHLGCEHGVCGACTVLLDGAPVRSCLLFAVSVDGAEVTTIEGCRNADGPNSPGTGGPHSPGTGGGLGPVQQAFADCHALQCGFCTPGFVTTVTAYLRDNPDPTEAGARQAIGGNLCRCTGYQNIVAAVLRAAELQRAGAGTGSPPATAGPVPAEPDRETAGRPYGAAR